MPTESRPKATSMKGIEAAILLGVLGASSVESFCIPPSPPGRAARARALHAEGGDADGPHGFETGFWGEPRDEQEIIDFVSDAVFDDHGDTSNDARPQWVEVISAEPPLLIVHGFLEDGYCDQIIDATLGRSLKRSTMGAEQEESDHRTSSTAWLREDRCPTPLRTFASRTAALSGLPPTNMENLQVVRYQPGEEFQLHTDHLDSFNEFDCGGRLCTCLVYLNDSEQSSETPGPSQEDNAMGNCVNEEDATFTGGETSFPEFSASISPTKGSALFFWNTLERPGSSGYDKNMFLNVDSRLRHAGLPVLSGEKWVANRQWMDMLRCKKKPEPSQMDPRPLSVIDEVVAANCVSFYFHQFLYPNRNPSRLHELCHNLCYVSRSWNEAFGLTRAQRRYDYMLGCLRDDDESEWLYYKISYVPHGADESGRRVPPEGCLRLYRSNCTAAMKEASSSYQNSVRLDPVTGVRVDSRPDYFYRAHREMAELVELVLPRPLPSWSGTIHFVNEIVHDEKPRLINRFSACLGDINGASNPMASGTSKEGRWDLGFHEVLSVRDMTTRELKHRPPLEGHGEDSTPFLRACKARPSGDPRWVRFAHLVGEDHCQTFIDKHLLPVLGPRPTGNSWKGLDFTNRAT